MQNKQAEVDDEIKVGQIVRFFQSRALGKVLEIDLEYHAARVKLMDGLDGECWANLDSLEVVVLEKPRERIEYKRVGAEQ